MPIDADNLRELQKHGILQEQVSLAHYTTWRVGGPAQWLAEPSDAEQIPTLLRWAANQEMPVRAIGAGSNLLIADEGLPGLTLCLRRLQGIDLNGQTGRVKASAGEPIPTLARRAARLGLQGLEWAVGIPGTVGGAAVMNAGAQGGCTAERLLSVDVVALEGEDFSIQRLERDALDFAYRHSALQGRRLLVLAAEFQLEPGHDPGELQRRTSGNLNHRTSTQPYKQPSCGSVFRNPEPAKAGRLIEGLGLKGRRVGGAQVSEVHANFIVNTGEARAADIRNLIGMVQQKVAEAHGIQLQPEVKRLGFEMAA
ncbi:UDP-N-acetylmuramate dehydrogenase [Synechococcus sp. MIT S9503]|uniref:UDP-N-acetylmuramate dehydrogenase n=1 Tax=Synechococcus sp. MIT S9503 TaxID=3082547 RepID=UPI0039A760B3